MLKKNKHIFGLLCVCYSQLCFILALRTQLFALIQKEYSLKYNHIATLVLVSGILLQTAAFFTGRIIKKTGYKKGLVCSFSIVVVSMLGMFLVASPAHFDVLFTCFTLGYGASTLILNMYTGVLVPENRAKNLIILHLGASIGLSIGPKVMDYCLSVGIGWQWVCFFAALPLIALTVVMFLHVEPEFEVVKEEQSEKKPMLTPITMIFIVIFACAQVWEFGIGTWFVIYAQKGQGLTSQEAANYLTIFLLCFPIARIIYARIIHLLRPTYSLFIAFVMNLGLCLCALMTGNIIFFAMTGIFTSLFYPVIMAIMQDTLGDRNSQVIGFVCMMGGLLQYGFIWFVGVLGDHISINIGFYSLISYLLVGAGMTVVLTLYLQQKVVCVKE